MIVSLLMAFGLLGLGAVAIDVGSWYAEKAQLQNGADSAALAIAQLCATGAPACTSAAAAPIAALRANNNSNDSLSNVDFVCGTGLGACPGSLCPAGTGNFVNVQTSTRTTSSSALPAIMSKALPGNSGSGNTIHACAQAKWGPPTSLGNAVALTISACEWLKNTSNGTKFATIPASGNYAAGAPYYTSPPSYLASITARRADKDYNTTPNDNTTNFYVTSNIKDPHNPVLNATVAGSETVITTHGFGNNCDAGNPGWAAPGQFGWLSKTTCTVPITGTTYGGSTGNTPAPCGPIFLNSLVSRTPIFMPVYTTATLSGSNTSYALDGFAAFVVTGWDVGGGVGQWNLNGSNVPTTMDSEIQLADASPNSSLSAANKKKDAHYCNDFTAKTGNADVCIYGYFTQALVSQVSAPGGGGPGGGTNLGATAPYLSG